MADKVLVITDKSKKIHLIEISEALAEELEQAFLSMSPSKFEQFNDETDDFKFDCTIDGVRFQTEDA